MGDRPQDEATDPLGSAALHKAKIKILPFIFILFIIAFLDRVNVGYAALSMTEDLHFSSAVFGFGAGIFFVGYFLLEIPGTWLIERWSARKWIARIMISWGLFTILNGFISSAREFYVVRFLIGLAESGFFPGMIVYLTHWFTASQRARVVAIFMSAIPISNIIAGPISGALLGTSGWGLAGWRWLFILEGIPALVFGVLTLYVLIDWPREAPWLTQDERNWLTEQLHKEREAKKAVRQYRIRDVFFEQEVLLLSCIYFLLVTGTYGITIWLPTLVARLSKGSYMYVGLLTSLVYLVGLVWMHICGRHSDRTRERKFHVAIPLIASSIGFIGAVLTSQPIFSLAFLTLAISGIYGCYGAFWSMPSQFLIAESAAVSIGLINSIGNLGGFVGPYIVGYVNSTTGSFFGGFAILASCVLLSGLLALLLKAPRPHFV